MTFLEKALGFDPKSMKLRTEIIAGATTFLTMSYILAVNPSILVARHGRSKWNCDSIRNNQTDQTSNR